MREKVNAARCRKAPDGKPREVKEARTTPLTPTLGMPWADDPRTLL